MPSKKIKSILSEAKRMFNILLVSFKKTLMTVATGFILSATLTSCSASNTASKAVPCLEPSEEQKTFIGHNDAVEYLSFSPDGQTLTSVSMRDNTVKFWKCDGTLLKTLPQKGAVYANFDGNEHSIVNLDFLAGISFALWKQNGAVTQTNSHDLLFDKGLFSADGKTFATANFHRMVVLWNREGKLISVLKYPRFSLSGLGISRDGQVIATAIEDKTVKLWNRDGTLLTTLQGNLGSGKKRRNPWPLGLVTDISFSDDGQTIAAVSGDNTVTLWKRDGTFLLNLSGHDDAINDITFSPDGQLVVTASDDKTVKLWKIDGTLFTTLTGHSGAINSISFSPDGRFIVTASDDKTIKLWKLSGLPNESSNLPHPIEVIGL